MDVRDKKRQWYLLFEVKMTVDQISNIATAHIDVEYYLRGCCPHGFPVALLDIQST